MKVAVLAAVAAFTLSAGAASAAIVSGSFGGSITSGTDTDGVFGTAGDDLTGDAFTGAFSFDTTLGVVANPFAPSAGMGIGGGLNVFGFGPSSPGVGSITIHGVTINLAAQGSLLTANDLGGGLSAQSLFLFDPSLAGGQISLSFGLTPTLPTDFNTPFSGDPCAAALICNGSFALFGSGGNRASGNLIANAYSYTADGVVSFTPTGGVPEPATWAMMITGFGLAGAALRRRQAATA